MFISPTIMLPKPWNSKPGAASSRQCRIKPERAIRLGSHSLAALEAPLWGLTGSRSHAALRPVPTTLDPVPASIETFITRWDGTAMAERANAQPFLSELCDMLSVPRPDPAQGGIGPYRFERNVIHHEADVTTTTRRIDLYRRACFVCEAKQGAAPHRQASLFTGETEA